MSLLHQPVDARNPYRGGVLDGPLMGTNLLHWSPVYNVALPSRSPDLLDADLPVADAVERLTYTYRPKLGVWGLDGPSAKRWKQAAKEDRR